MSIQEQIVTDWKEAMKARHASKDVLSLIRTELKNKAINSRTDGSSTSVVSDEEALDVLMKMAKQRRESIAQYETASRQDLVDKESFELSVIENYLPKQLDDSQIEEVVKNIIAQEGATSLKDMGKVMSKAMQECKGRAEGKKIQEKVKTLLGN